LVLPPRDGPTHPYLGASPACWALFGELLVREFSLPGWSGLHRLTVDAYAVQHPGVPERRSIRSVALHLMSLCLVVERGVAAPKATKLLGRIAGSAPAPRWLDPPRPNGTITVADVLLASAVEEHLHLIESWAADVWGAWEIHSGTVRGWLAESLRD